MGVLDDAIREHLDLKRKHGVPEEELQRQEEEALGPARRSVSQDQEALADGETAVAEAEVEEGELSPEADAAEFAEAEAGELGEQEQQAEAADAAPQLVEPPAADVDVPPESSAEDTVLFDSEAEDAPSGDTPGQGFAPAQAPEPAPPPEAAEPDEPDEPDPDATQEYDPFAEEPDHEHEPPTDAADAADAEEGDGDGDVLEDTPDFLQETPEHDRLWFEQKPPRDFDFD
ncbi:MAG TPA: hypothetical protein VHJ37_09710 [Thermoleophilaceae bacterium]|jgi:hypothetical protein|nr:hypothetical protein [Thermoleophilaceae bacterium]